MFCLCVALFLADAPAASSSTIPIYDARNVIDGMPLFACTLAGWLIDYPFVYVLLAKSELLQSYEHLNGLPPAVAAVAIPAVAAASPATVSSTPISEFWTTMPDSLRDALAQSARPHSLSGCPLAVFQVAVGPHR